MKQLLASSEPRDVIHFPFPLSDGTVVLLQLPKDGLTSEDCDRLENYLRSLVFDNGAAGLEEL